MNSAILTLDELAKYLRLPPAIIQEQVAQGNLPGRQIADEWRFLKDAIDDWLRCQDDNRPILPLSHHHSPAPVPKRDDGFDRSREDSLPVSPDNPWAAYIGRQNDAEVAEIEAELRAESDLGKSAWME
jgi:excisionase family DNA binding protein